MKLSPTDKHQVSLIDNQNKEYQMLATDEQLAWLEPVLKEHGIKLVRIGVDKTR